MNLKSEVNNEYPVSIDIDKFMTINLSIPTRMTAVEFMGLMAKVNKAIPKNIIDDAITPKSNRAGYFLWTNEQKDLVRKNMKKRIDEVRKIFSETEWNIPVHKLDCMYYKMRKEHK